MQQDEPIERLWHKSSLEGKGKWVCIKIGRPAKDPLEEGKQTKIYLVEGSLLRYIPN